ncbi:MAG: T9SS type A sorting domain-containing protein, partial [Bacteroidia bacterium]
YAGGCDLVAGTTYYVMVDNAGASSNAGTFTLTVANLSNDNPSNAAILSSCGVNFTSSTIGATNCDNCIGTWYNNLDCNNSTSVGSGSGSDVYSGMSVENDSWYVFCTTTAGTYTVTLSAVNSSCIGSNASSSSELQCNCYTGVGALSYTALGWQYGDYFGNAWSEVVPITLAANGCCYIEVDGYAGTNCNYSLVLSGACTLPIELLSFSGENIESRKNKLKWTTASETQTSFYYVERSSDAKKFIQIGKLKAAGTSTTPRNYEFYDEQPFSGDNYYRLITVDINGKEEIASSVVITNKIQHPVLTVYPNPAKNFLNVDLTNFSSPTINLDVVDMYGRTVWSSELSTVDGGLKTQIDLSGFGGGMYFVKVYDGNDFYKKRIFVSRD